MSQYTNREAITNVLDVIKKVGWLIQNHEDRIKQLEERVNHLQRHEDDGR